MKWPILASLLLLACTAQASGEGPGAAAFADKIMALGVDGFEDVHFIRKDRYAYGWIVISEPLYWELKRNQHQAEKLLFPIWKATKAYFDIRVVNLYIMLDHREVAEVEMESALWNPDKPVITWK